MDIWQVVEGHVREYAVELCVFQSIWCLCDVCLQAFDVAREPRPFLFTAKLFNHACADVYTHDLMHRI